VIVMAEKDPLNPENDIFWEGPGAIRPSLQKAAAEAKAKAEAEPRPYSLNPKPTILEPDAPSSSKGVNTSTSLKRPAGPWAPNQKRPSEYTEPDIKRMRETAAVFGYGRNEVIEKTQLLKMNKATDGFRKMYLGALTANTTERDLENYFSTFGPVEFCQVIRNRDTGQTKGFGFITMKESVAAQKILSQAVHVVDCRSIRVSMTHTLKNEHWEPSKDYQQMYVKREEDRIQLLSEVNGIDVREGRLYCGPLPFNVSPNILADKFSTYGNVVHADVCKADQNMCKKPFGVIHFKETMAVKRALQNPRHFINEQYVDVTLSRFAMEAFLSPSTLWIWQLAWSITKEDLVKYFSKFGKVYRAMHVYNPVTGDKKGYGFVDFVDQACLTRACGGPQKVKTFEIKGQKCVYAKFLDKQLKRDFSFMEDRFGNMLSRSLNAKVPDSGEWGGGKEFNDVIKKDGAKTVTCKLPKSMLPVVVGEDGKIIAEIAKDSGTKITMLKPAPQEENVLFHIVGSPDHCKTAQYMMQIKIKERMTKPNQMRYNR